MPKNLPAAPLETEIAATLDHWIDLVAEALTTDAARTLLRAHIRERVRQGTIPTMQVIEAARAGHEDADAALRELAAEMLDHGEMPPAALRTYAQEALVRPPTTYPRGRNLTDFWLRDVAIAVIVAMGVERWSSLPPTRNRASKRPSMCGLVSLALGRRHISVGERRVEKIYADHGKLAARLSASMPAI